MTSKRLTVAELVDQVARRAGLTVEQVKAVLKAQAELAYEHAAEGFRVPGIGILRKIESPARQMVMRFGPDAGQEKTIPASRKLRFAVSRVAKEMVLGRAGPMPDLFKDPELAEFKFSTDSTELADPSLFIGELGGPLAVARDGSNVSLVVRRLADLWLPTGRIVAADAMIGGSEPFARSVPAARYPTAIAIALETSERVAFAIIRFSEARVAKWEMAVPEGKDASALKSGQVFGYGVDSGTGSFCDASVQQLLLEVNEADAGFFERAVEEMGAGRWLHVETPQGSLALFSSGFGDGRYASYFGLDEAGNPAMLVTDFQVVKSRFSE